MMSEESNIAFSIIGIPKKYWEEVGMYPIVKIDYKKLGEPSEGFMRLIYNPESKKHVDLSGEGLEYDTYEVEVHSNDPIYPPEEYFKGELFADFIKLDLPIVILSRRIYL